MTQNMKEVPVDQLEYILERLQVILVELELLINPVRNIYEEQENA